MAEIQVKAKDGSGQFTAYVAKPASGKGPGILLIQEIFGVNKVMRDLADGFARQGYVVACPDLFWRQKPGIQITDQSEAVIRVRAISRSAPGAWIRRVIITAVSKRTAPYPMSPRVTPKNSGKDNAMNGVGSNDV